MKLKFFAAGLIALTGAQSNCPAGYEWKKTTLGFECIDINDNATDMQANAVPIVINGNVTATQGFVVSSIEINNNATDMQAVAAPIDINDNDTDMQTFVVSNVTDMQPFVVFIAMNNNVSDMQAFVVSIAMNNSVTDMQAVIVSIAMANNVSDTQALVGFHCYEQQCY